MNDENIKRLYDILKNIHKTDENIDLIEEIRNDLDNHDYMIALSKLEKLGNQKQEEKKMKKKEKVENKNEVYPAKLSNPHLEKVYIALLLNEPKFIVKYYFVYEDCFFEDKDLLNIYKSILFTEGGDYTPEVAKRNFNFAKDDEKFYGLKVDIKNSIIGYKYNMEEIYVKLKKLFLLRKNYLKVPIKEIQDKIVEIKDYLLYDKMSVEEVESAIIQVNDTRKFKRAILNEGLTSFLELGDNNLTNGLDLPFPILTKVFKGIRRGETMAIAMPSNSGKSRLSINLAAHTALVHKKKVLIISNEMSEDKMRLCLITTIINNKEIQKLHGESISKTEGELLEFKFRPDENIGNVEVDEDGFVIRKPNESQEDFVERLKKVSTEFNKVIRVTDWANEQIKNSIYFINITDHTNDELRKVIMNYYYKEQIEYIFYDTLKTDTENIGIGEELKKTATILSNLAQNFNLFICSTLQLAENDTLPINLNVNDLAVSRTVKEVLDTLSLLKQINRDTLQNYEHSLNEVDTEYFKLEKFDDPDVRYYSCVIDKNRAGAKPILVFRLNLAYNVWEELGYLRLKQ